MAPACGHNALAAIVISSLPTLFSGRYSAGVDLWLLHAGVRVPADNRKESAGYFYIYCVLEKVDASFAIDVKDLIRGS